MPSLSSVFSNGPAAFGPPRVTFTAADNQGHIRAIDSCHQEVAHFIVGKGFISRRHGRFMHMMCSFKRSSLSGTTRIHMHGRQIKMKQSWEGMQYGKDIQAPMGTLKWRPGSKGYQELRDGRKTLLARGKLPGTFHSKPSALKVFAPGDEFLWDLILASWIGTIQG